MESTQSRLLKKAKEAFLLAVEIYNKPTIRYRVEGFSLFIVNAWELMLKAHLINKHGEEAIYYPDNQKRTLALENCIRKIFTNEKDPLRLNLEKIVELRNTSTHFITEEYEAIYIPLFQANVYNFVDKLKEFHGIEATDFIPENFLSLSVSFSQLSEAGIRAKYSDHISARLIEMAKKVASCQANITSDRFAIVVEHTHYLTKKKNDATQTFSIANDSDSAIFIMSKRQDPNQTHPFSTKRMYEKLNSMLERSSVELKYRGAATKINQFHFRNLCRYYSIKDNEKYCYCYTRHKQPQYSYSQSAVDFLFNVLRESPDEILDKIVTEKDK